jgi:DnaA family protein
MAQLPLALTLKAHASFASFVSGPNAQAVDHVRAVASGQRHDSIWLRGPAGSGKSHLLAAACRLAGDSGRRAIYLPLGADREPGMLSNLDDVDLIAIDDLHRVAGQPAWEAALFPVFDARLERGGVVAAAEGSPHDCGFSLRDLESRAAAATIYRLGFLDDDDLEQAVRGHAGLRGLSLDAAAASFLTQRFSRDLGKLISCLDRIDRYSLAAQRRVTIPLLREVIDP